ncbi:MAG TPA: hypothetical protein VJ001_14145 [Rhodocyclaceae bacterium]|nr:hypothetical protein [Rhodocyclaceae bacterium]
MLQLLTGAVGLSLILAYLGRNRRMGFWGMLFGSILLTPLIGLIILLVTDDVKPDPAPQSKQLSASNAKNDD